MGDQEAPQTRERVWLRKIDHSTDPPTPVEEIFAEDGVIRTVTDLQTGAVETPNAPPACARCGGQAAALKVNDLSTGEVRQYCPVCWVVVSNEIIDALRKAQLEQQEQEQP